LAFVAAFASDSWGKSKRAPQPETQSTQTNTPEQRGPEKSPVVVKVLPTQEADEKAKADAKEHDKTDSSIGIFDFLKNLVLLGALKYLAEKTQSPFVEFAFATCALFFVMLCFSFLLAWRVRLVSAFRRNRYTESVDVVLNTIALLAIQLRMVAFTIRIANQLALAQGH